MFFKQKSKIDGISLQEFNKLSANDKDDELLTNTTFANIKTNCENKHFDLAYRDLKAIADDVWHYKGTRIRGKALYHIYLLAKDGQIDLPITQQKNKDDVLTELLTTSANYGYEAAIIEQNQFNPFFDIN